MSLLDTLQNLTSKRKTSTKQKKQSPRQEVLPFGNEKKYHLVLSGGGLRGFAHIGVYQALIEQGIEIASVAGTSLGALVGVFIAAQKGPQELTEIFTQKSVYRLLDISFSRQGMFSVKRIQELITKELGYTDIAELPLPFTVCVTDFIKGQAVYYNQGNIEKIVMASCAIPGVFEPIAYDDTLLVDGGVFDNMPVGTQDELPIIGVHVNPRIFDPNEPTKDIAVRSLEMLIGRDIQTQKEKCALFFEPPALADLGFGLATDPKEIIQIGYDYAMSILQRTDTY